VLVGSLLAALAGVALAATQAFALAELIHGVDLAAPPWRALGEAMALCAVVAVTASVLAAWRTTRGQAIRA
jgi:hypothetical protein